MALKDALARNGITSTNSGDGSNNNNNQGGTGDGGAGTGGSGSDGDGANASGEAGKEGGAAGPAASALSTIDDDTLLKAMKERGIEVSNFEEVRTRFTPAAPAEPTAEEKKQAEEKRKAEARAFALRNNIVTTNTLDDFARESAMPYTDLGYQLWKQERLEGLTPEQIAEFKEQDLVDEFHDEYSLYAEETDAKRIRREKELKSKVEAHLKGKYGKVYELESEYDAHLADQQDRTSYNANVSEAVKSIGDTLTFSIKEGEKDVPFSFKLPQGALEQATQEFLSDASFKVFGKSKQDAKAITTLIQANLKSKHLDQIISYIATTHADNKVREAAKGRRGIPEQEIGTNGHQPGATGGENKNPNMKRHLAQHSQQTGYKKSAVA